MTNPPIHTIGYGSRTIEQFLNALERAGIQYLVDVRSRPYSKFKPEFSKAPLEACLRKHGIPYVFMGDQLGGQPEDQSLYVDGKVDYEKLRQTDAYRQGIEGLVRVWKEGTAICLMCGEEKPQECHRSRLIGATLENLKIPVLHIAPAGTLLTQEQVVFAATGGQLSLFQGRRLPRERSTFSEVQGNG